MGWRSPGSRIRGPGARGARRPDPNFYFSAGSTAGRRHGGPGPALVIAADAVQQVTGTSRLAGRPDILAPPALRGQLTRAPSATPECETWSGAKSVSTLATPGPP